jgi:uncharacterized Zn finger protein
MICEKCGCHDKVIRTVRKETSTVRIRRCIACGYAVVTEERQIQTENVKVPASKPKPKPKPKPNPKPKKAKGALERALAESVE